jgi:hypothetical protein
MPHTGSQSFPALATKLRKENIDMEVTIFGFIEAVSQTSASLALDQSYNRVALQSSSQP